MNNLPNLAIWANIALALIVAWNVPNHPPTLEDSWPTFAPYAVGWATDEFWGIECIDDDGIIGILRQRFKVK